MYVDFHHVPEHQREIDARLANWGRWSMNRSAGGMVSPMFRLYRSTDASQQYGQLCADPVDARDAVKVQKAMAHIASRNRLALSWCYIRRNNPRKAAMTLGVSLQGLMELILDGRTMLRNVAEPLDSQSRPVAYTSAN
jgi:DNA-directed RNA polymerase specialized sigma24 family protein